MLRNGLPSARMHPLIPILTITFIALVAGLSCERDNEDPGIPVLYTGEIVEITNSGSVFTGLFRNVEAQQVTDYGFMWALEEDFARGQYLKYSLPLPFEKEIHSYTNNSSLVKDATYYMRIFMTYDNKVTYYGKAISFYSLGSKAPLISSVNPSEACFGDTVEISGKYFGLDPHDKRILFGSDEGLLVMANDSVIQVRVPYFSGGNSYFTDGKVNLKIVKSDYYTASTDLFQLSPPRISSYSPVEGKSGTGISITGYGFHPDFTEVSVGGHSCEIDHISYEHIEAVLPSLFQDLEEALTVDVANKSSSPGTIKVLAPVMHDFSADSVFSYEKLTLYGNHLANEGLSFFLGDKPAEILNSTDDSITLEVPGSICAGELFIEMRLKGASHVHAEPLGFIQPRNIEIRTIENNLFDGEISITGDYLPEVTPGFRVELNGSGSSYAFNFQGTSSSLDIQVPAEAGPVDEWLNAYIDFCPSTQLSIDSVFHIPPPQILSAGDTVFGFSGYTLTGDNFNSFAERNQVFLGEHFIRSYMAQDRTHLQFTADDRVAAGSYPLRVNTNGQESNTVDVELVHRWNRLAELPENMMHHAFMFLHEDVLYMGGGSRNYSYSFYSFDLLTEAWTTKSPLPVNYGLSFSDAGYGYIFGDNQLYRYDFDTDTWLLLSEKDIAYSSGFIYDNKIFILSVGIDQIHYYYDLSLNTWSEFEGPSSPNTNMTVRAVLNEAQNEAYLFHGEDIWVLDLVNLTMHESGGISSSAYYDGHRSGFEYSGEAYLWDYEQWAIYDIQDFSQRHIGGPVGGSVTTIRDGDRVYFLNHDDIWSFDLTMQ